MIASAPAGHAPPRLASTTVLFHQLHVGVGFCDTAQASALLFVSAKLSCTRMKNSSSLHAKSHAPPLRLRATLWWIRQYCEPSSGSGMATLF